MSPTSVGSTGTAFRDLHAGATAARSTRASRAGTRIVDLLSGLSGTADFVALLDGAFLLDLRGAVGIIIVRFRDFQDLRPRHFLAVAEDQDLLAGLERETGLQLHEHPVRVAHHL